MPSLLPKFKTPSPAIRVTYRIAWIVCLIVAISGFFANKHGFHFFLLAALVAAVGAGDLNPARVMVEALRLLNGKGK